MPYSRNDKKQFGKYLQEVETAIDEIPLLKPPDPKFNLQHYLGTQYHVKGISMPQARKRFKEGYSFSGLPAETQYEIWKYIWCTSNTHEVMTQALFFCEKFVKTASPEWFFAELCMWLERIDNWAHSDALTHHFAALNETHPAMVYPVLQQWNNSANPWERRQSILSLLDYARFRKKYPTVARISKLITPRLKDENIFVQKAIGWCLRESYYIYPDDIFAFMIKHHADLSSIAFTAATEKYPAAKKEKIKSLRKQARTK